MKPDMTKQMKAAVKAFKTKAQASVAVIAKERDKLRKLISDYEDILECCDDGMRDFEDAIERISELL